MSVPSMGAEYNFDFTTTAAGIILKFILCNIFRPLNHLFLFIFYYCLPFNSLSYTATSLLLVLAKLKTGHWCRLPWHFNAD